MSQVKVKPAHQVVDVSNQDDISMTQKVDGDIVIVGKAVAKKVGNIANSSMISTQANVTLRAIGLKDGRILGSSYAHAAKVHIDPVTAGTQGIQEATKQASKKLLQDIIKAWNDALNNGDEFLVEVKNLSESVDMYKAEKTISTIKTVSAVILDKFEMGTARFRVMFRGNAYSLSKKLEKEMKLIQISGKKVVLEMK